MFDIPEEEVLSNDLILRDSLFHNLKILRLQTNKDHKTGYKEKKYEFLQNADLTRIRSVLSLKGYVAENSETRLIVTAHLSLQNFVRIVLYDPSEPPLENYEQHQMFDIHQRTQSDFKSAKKKNKELFKEYLIESVNGDRIPYLPTISGWQSKKYLENTFFVAFDESNKFALYGDLYLPKKPIMQADGQTQTAALFALAKSKEAIEIDEDILENFNVALEIELDMDERKAGNSFADRNGRGSKKSANLIIGLANDAPLSKLRDLVIENTIFVDRIDKGKGPSPTLTKNENIVNLSTLEQILLHLISDNTIKPEQIKSYHISHIKNYCHKFFLLLENQFGSYWPKEILGSEDPYRRIYLHGWPFALKGIASAYFRACKNEIGPFIRAISDKEKRVDKTDQENFEINLNKHRRNWTHDQKAIGFDEFEIRIKEIDWKRHRKHWIEVTGYKVKDGKAKIVELNSESVAQVDGLCQNHASSISKISDAILAYNWEKLKSHQNFEIT